MNEKRYCGECGHFEESFDILGFCSLKGEIVCGEDEACEHFEEAVRDA